MFNPFLQSLLIALNFLILQIIIGPSYFICHHKKFVVPFKVIKIQKCIEFPQADWAEIQRLLPLFLKVGISVHQAPVVNAFLYAKHLRYFSRQDSADAYD